jgi:hypothetical protein
MPDRATIERIAKLVARATMTDNKPESEAAIRGAYSRMKRDGVSFEDLLTLPDELLYQRGLMELVGHIVAEQSELSEGAKRDMYAQLAARVAKRYAGPTDDQSASERRRERERQEQESNERASAEQGRRRSEHANTEKSSNSFAATAVFSRQGAAAVLKNMLIVSAGSFARGGFMWHALRAPAATARLFASAALFGTGIGLLLLVIAASIHSWLGIGGPWIDMRFTTAWALVGTPLALFKIIALHRRGWF